MINLSGKTIAISFFPSLSFIYIYIHVYLVYSSLFLSNLLPLATLQAAHNDITLIICPVKGRKEVYNRDRDPM